MRRALYIFIVSIFLMNLVFCYRDKPVGFKHDPDMVLTKTPNASRSELVKQCGQCHKKEYANELIGPHANSYTKLVEYVEKAKLSPYFPKDYTQYIATSYNSVCVKCHAGADVYGASLKCTLGNNDLKDLFEKHSAEINAFTNARPDSTTWITGVDCITCHQAGDNVITTLTSTASRSAFCRPIGSAIYATNYNCVSCHKFAINTAVDNIHNPAITKDMSCMNCHMEYDQQNKPTHYMYWRHDPAEKKRAEVNSGIFNDLKIDVRKGEGNKRTLNVQWANKKTPHGYSECGEIFVVIKAKSDNATYLTDTVRINNKKYLDSDVAKLFKSGIVPGVLGYTFRPADPAFVKDTPFVVPAGVKNVSVTIEAYEKMQYWIGDGAAEKIYTRTDNF